MTDARELAHEILNGCIVMCPGELPTNDDHNDVCNGITSAFITARNAALEEAASACDERVACHEAERCDPTIGIGASRLFGERAYGARRCAVAIRQLKEPRNG